MKDIIYVDKRALVEKKKKKCNTRSIKYRHLTWNQYNQYEQQYQHFCAHDYVCDAEKTSFFRQKYW